MEAKTLHRSEKTRTSNRNTSGLILPQKTSQAQETLKLLCNYCVRSVRRKYRGAIYACTDLILS